MISDALSWVGDFLQWLFVDFAYAGVLDAFADVIEAIQMPDAITEVGNLASSVASGPFGWAWSVMQFGPGLTMVAGAFALRFILRRIPFIGG